VSVAIYIVVDDVTDGCVYRDGAYVQFIRPKGNLEQNLRNQLRA